MIIVVLTPVFYVLGAGIIQGDFAFWYTIEILLSLVTLSVVYALFINRTAFLPLKIIDRFLVESTSSGDLSRRLSISGGTEVSRLVKSINELLSKLEELMMKEKARCETLESVVEESTKALRLSEAKYKELIELANSIILKWDPEGKILWINKYGLDYFGFSEEEVIGRSIYDTFVPKTSIASGEIQKLIDEITQDGVQQYTSINENVKKDGTRVWIHWSSRPIKDEEGRLVAILSVGNDITAKIQMETIRDFELKKASVATKLYQQIISPNVSILDVLKLMIEEAICSTDSEFGIIGAAGTKDDEFAFYTFKEGNFLPLETKDMSNEKSSKMDLLGELKTIRPICKNSVSDDQKTCFSAINPNIRRFVAIPALTHGRLVGVILVFNKNENYDSEDLELLSEIGRYLALTIQRFMLEDKVHRELKEILTLFDSIDEPIYVADPFTYEVIFANKYLINLLGHSPIGKPCYTEFQGSDRPCNFCNNKLLFEKGTHKWVYYNPLLDKHYAITDKIIKWPDGRDVRFELAIDITDRVRLEKTLEEKILELQKYSERLEKIVQERTKALLEKERIATIGETALMVGHDLRNPLQTIRYSLYLMEKDLKDNTAIMAHINRIERSVQYMNKIVSDLQDLSKPMKIDPSRANLMNIIKESLSMVEVPYNVEVMIDVDPSAEGEVDSRLIKRALVNLIINAVQSMPKGGKMRLSAKMEGGFITFSIEDTGCGMSQDTMKRIFEPFYTNKSKGMGLGLKVVKRIVENHGGKIFIESEVGKGTKFELRIPQPLNI
ncbi:MAG: ATP-binding protein [Candidatus Methanomethylicaceae archaeon]